MIHDQWQQYLQNAPAQPSQAREPAVSGTPTAGMAYVPALAAVRFRGADARKFLQGYLTCDTAELAPGTLTPTALCSLKGRVVMNGWCAPDGEQDVVMVLHDSLVETLQSFLRTYLAFSRTTLEDERPRLLVLAGLDLPVDSGGMVMDARRRLFLVDDLESARSLWESHPHVSGEDWLAALTADDIPLVSAPVSERFLPQMLNLQTLGAINFEKGCYLGQEVVARAQHRGQVKRRLEPLRWEGPSPPAPGSEVSDDTGRAVGVVVQSARSGPDGGPLLAVLAQGAAVNLQQADTDLKRVS